MTGHNNLNYRKEKNADERTYLKRLRLILDCRVTLCRDYEDW